MRTKLITLHIIFLIAISAIVITVLFSASTLITLASVVLTLALAFIILRSWLGFIKKMVVKSDTVLRTTPSRSILGFSQIEKLERNQDLVARKFEVSIELISNLGQPEKVGFDTSLISNDPIGKALQRVRGEMQQLKDEDEKQTWVTTGLARFASILRNKTELKEYSYQILSNLVKYIGANQGALFIEGKNSDGERFMELTASYAYEKRKYEECKVLEGQGMLGQCMLEMDMIFITDVPQDYVKITSGLGMATPRNIVVAPLIFNGTFFGAIELALFDIMKPHQVDFLKKISEDIASEISSSKNVAHTKELLEEAHALTQELQSSEEEMKQNMVELAATQEEMSRNQAELTGIVHAIDKTLASAEFDLSGKCKKANDIFLRVMNYSVKELENIRFLDMMSDEPSAILMWENLKLGKFFSGEFKMQDKAGKELWLSGTCSPIILKGGTPDKIVMFAQFTTQDKEKQNDLNGMVHALKSTLPVIEFNENFTCKTANEIAMKLFSLSRMDLRNKTITDFIAPFYQAAWKMRQPEILKNDFSSHVIPVMIKNHETSYEVSVSVIKNLEGSVSKVIVLFVREAHQQVSILAAM